VPEETKVPFNRIVISEGERQRVVATEEFMAINLHKRMTMILEDRVQFFDGKIKLATTTALKALYRAQR
jgi:hypothetical protein